MKNGDAVRTASGNTGKIYQARSDGTAYVRLASGAHKGQLRLFLMKTLTKI